MTRPPQKSPWAQAFVRGLVWRDGERVTGIGPEQLADWVC